MSQSVCLSPAALPRAAATQARPAATLASPGTVLTGLVLQLLDWQRRARERQELAGLSDTALRDVGLSRADIFPEIRKPFWRA